MKKGYWIVHVTVTDPDGYPDYVAANKQAFEKYGGRFLVRGGDYTAPEGPARDRHVVLEFDSYQQALDCYHSAEYRDALALRKKCSEAEIVIVEGV